MKKLIFVLLLGILLILSMASCELLDSILPNATDETTSPKATTPKNTSSDDIFPPGSTNETTPDDTDTTTPVDNTNSTFPSDDNNDIPPEDEVITFTAEPFLSNKTSGPLSNPIEFTIDNGDIIINIPNYLNNALYESYYVKNIELIFPDEIEWYVEETEQVLATYEKLKSSKASYILQTSKKYSKGFNPAIVYYIEDIYYFVIPYADSAEIKTVYYTTESGVHLPLSDKNIISSYPENLTPELPTESDPLVVELFGEGRMDFEAELIAVLKYFSDWSDLSFTVKNGNIYLADQYWCKMSHTDDIKVHFSQEVEGISDYKWFVEENEQIMQVIEKITNSDYCYVLNVQDFSYLNELLMYDIDGDYYFVMRSTSGTVKKLYCLTEN